MLSFNMKMQCIMALLQAYHTADKAKEMYEQLAGYALTWGILPKEQDEKE